MQIQLFETVMHSDNSDALYTLTGVGMTAALGDDSDDDGGKENGGGGGGGAGGNNDEGRRQLALADPKQLFRALHATAVEFDCAPLFLSTLQHMILVPSYDELGKHMWQQIEAAVHAVVLPAEEHKE